MRWCSTRRGRRSARRSFPTPSPARARCSLEVARAAASAEPTCTSSTASCRPEAAARPRATRSSGGSPAAASGSRRRPGRHPVARLDVRRVPLLPERPREPLRPRTLHGLHARRRLRRAGCRRRALLRPDPGRVRRRARPRRSSAPGLIGYRALRMAGDAERLGLYGFGASAHIVAQVARHAGPARVRVHACRRRGRAVARPRARRGMGRRLGTARRPRSSTPRSCSRRPASSSRRRCGRSPKGAVVVCAGIHMSDIPSFPYELLWGERVGALGREPDAARRRGVHGARARGAGADAEIEVFPLAEANEALARLRRGEVRGAAVLAVSGS